MKYNPQNGHRWDSSDSMTSNNGKEPVKIHCGSSQARLSISRVKNSTVSQSVSCQMYADQVIMGLALIENVPQSAKRAKKLLITGQLSSH